VRRPREGEKTGDLAADTISSREKLFPGTTTAAKEASQR
jgi:hypothetical protein